MLLKKRLEFGFSGYKVPVTPQATRSARKRPVFRKNLQPDYCAFDLLVTVAGNLLRENDVSSPSVEKTNEKPNESILNIESRDHGSCSKTFPSPFTSDDDENSSGCTQPSMEEDKEMACYKRISLQKNYPSRKRKLFYCSNSDGGVTSEAIPSSPEIDVDASYLSSKDNGVKLKIKSFRVPELFVDVPENATVGILKKSVMEAVSSLLGGGLQVGILLQGKKVREDEKTLLEIGISGEQKPGSLNFILEPKSPRGLTDSYSSQPLARFSIGVNTVNIAESDGDSAPSEEMVAVPQASVEALTLIPLQQKVKKPDAPQRRVRRPFSVSEVEALVQAVEMLGTGRWRDVKLRAFLHAKHRTYVDLKDKWKTLVHTARISPQQRRGEAVPQELLDRVLVAHAYWAKQHHVVPETRLLLGRSS